mgnify:FL=1
MTRSRYAHLYAYGLKVPEKGLEVEKEYRPSIEDEDKLVPFITKRRLISENPKLAAPRSFNVNCSGKRHTLSIDEFGTLILQHHNIEDAAAESYFGGTLKCFEIWTAWQAFKKDVENNSGDWIVDRHRRNLPRQLHAHARFFAGAWNVHSRGRYGNRIGQARRDFELRARTGITEKNKWTLFRSQERRKEVLEQKFRHFYGGFGDAIGEWENNAALYWTNGVYRKARGMPRPCLEAWFQRVYLNCGPSLGGNPLILDFKKLSESKCFALCFPVQSSAPQQATGGLIQWHEGWRGTHRNARWFFPELPDECSLDLCFDGRTRKHRQLDVACALKHIGGEK